MLSNWSYGEDVRFWHFERGAKMWNIDTDQMMKDFINWLKTGETPHYVNDMIRRESEA
jgi:hypothetical protein